MKCPYSKKFIEERRQDLLAKRTKTLRQLKSVANQDPHQKNNFNAGFPDYGDKEDENASEVAEFAGNLSLESTLEQTLEMIDKALNKIDNGTYGICEKTGRCISKERLKIMPTATKATSPDQYLSENEE